MAANGTGQSIRLVTISGNDCCLNPDAVSLISQSNHPQFLVLTGKARAGKSTTLNQFANGCRNQMSYRFESPFRRGNRSAVNTHDPITEGADIYGPIKMSDLLDNCCVNAEEIADCDVFLVDTEGLYSCEGTTQLISAVFAANQISTLCVHFGSYSSPDIEISP